MINSEIIDNGMGNSGTDIPLFHKQPPIGTKKSVLRDVQNDTRNLIYNREETLPFVEGKSVTNASKLSGTKRLTPEYPSTHFPNNGVNKHFTYAHKKTETEPIKPVGPQLGYFCQMQREVPQKQSNVNFLPVVTTNHMSSITSHSYGPTSLGKPGNGLFAVEHDSHKVTTEVPCSVDNRLRKERFGSLQNYLKNYNEFDKRDYTQMLLHLAPAELSRHAVDLEKRAIQLTIEEGKEIQRMKQLNILGKTVTTNDHRETSQQLQSKK